MTHDKKRWKFYFYSRKNLPSRDNLAEFYLSCFITVTTTNEFQLHKFYWICVAAELTGAQFLEQLLMASLLQFEYARRGEAPLNTQILLRRAVNKLEKRRSSFSSIHQESFSQSRETIQALNAFLWRSSFHRFAFSPTPVNPISMFTPLKRFSIHGMMEEEGNVLKPHQEIAALSLEEKRYLLAVERGDVASSRR